MILCGRGWSTCSSWMQVSGVGHGWRRYVTNIWCFCVAVALGLLLTKSFMHCERQRLVKPDCFWAGAPLPVRTIQSDLMQIMVRDGERVYFMSTHESWHGLGIGYFVCNMGLSITNLIIIKSTNVSAMLDRSFSQDLLYTSSLTWITSSPSETHESVHLLHSTDSYAN